MRRLLAFIGTLTAITAIAVAAWRRNRRIGVAFVNTVVNPALVRRGLTGGRSELGTIEHVGRVSGIERCVPVHPEPTSDGFRILVPLGEQSEWARNVLAAAHWRLHLHDAVFELDEPTMIPASQATDLPTPIRRLLGWLGFEYLSLRTFASAPVAANPEPETIAADDQAAAETVTATAEESEPAASAAAGAAV